MGEAPPGPGARGDGDGAGARAYLIVLRHVVVAQDIALTVADHDPGAAVVVCASAAEALERLDGRPLAVAFVAEAPRAFAGSALERAIAERGGRAVLIGEAAEAEGEALGFAVLPRPFATAAVLRHLGA